MTTINGIEIEKVKVEVREATGFRVGAGVNVANLSYVSKDEFGNEMLAKNARSSPSLKYWVSVGYDLAKNPLAGRMVFRGDISFSEAELTTNTHDYRYSSDIDIWHTFKQHNITLGLSGIYHLYNKEKIKIYIGSGGRLNFAFYQYDSEFNLTTETDPPITDTFKLIDAEPRKLFFSVPFNAGIVLNKKIELRIMYCLPATLSHDNFIYKYDIRYFQGGLVYHF